MQTRAELYETIGYSEYEALDATIAARSAVPPDLHVESNDSGRMGIQIIKQMASRTEVKLMAGYDVIVVGGGNAALCAALAARENGARVIVLECAPIEERGGNSALHRRCDARGLQRRR